MMTQIIQKELESFTIQTTNLSIAGIMAGTIPLGTVGTIRLGV
tara:strand:+ start:417 stop:545 length:129 start_codon:yes stop_codon:yes gene_type:complete